MYKSILIPLDGSTIAEHALRSAIAIAKTTGARISLVHVAAPGPPGITYMAGPEEYLNEVAERVSADLNESVDIHVIRPNDDYFISRTETARLIAEYAKTHSAELIVMSTKGRGGVARTFIGSVADSLLRLALCPMLLVRPRSNASSTTVPSKPFKRVLVAVDKTPASESVIDEVGQLVGSNAHISLVHVILPMPAYALYSSVSVPETEADDWSLYSEKSAAYLDELAAKLTAEGRLVSRHTVASSNVADAIVAAARKLKPDLIALSSSAPRPLLRAIVGSVADEVVRHAPCPVFVTREA